MNEIHAYPQNADRLLLQTPFPDTSLHHNTLILQNGIPRKVVHQNFNVL